MRTGARIAVFSGLLGLLATGCASIAGIEDLSLTGSPDAASDVSQPSGDATMDASGSSSGSSSGSGGDAKSDTSTFVDAGTCSPGQIRCSGNAVQTCGGNGQWAIPQACVDQTCLTGACVGMCAPGQTHPVPCGNCGMDTQTCTSSGSWQSSGTCSGQGACMPSTTQGCNTYGTQTCTASCAWGTCSCPSAPACTPGQAQCSGTGVETCGACGQYANPAPCTSGACAGGMCSGMCSSAGQVQCSGNSTQTCNGGMWQTTGTCMNQTCINGACTGVCAPGQTRAVSCGNCGTDTQTCDSTGNWQSSGSCAGQGVCTPQATMQCNMYGIEQCSSTCAWGACSCTSTPVCTPGQHQCSGNGVQTCDSCGQWGTPVSCGAGMTCTGGGSCVQSPTDCPGNFLLCDGFESGSLDTTTKWQPPNCASGTTMTVDTHEHHSGSYALHVQFGALTGQTYDWCWTKTQQMSIFSSTPMYFRAWVWFSVLPGTDNETLIDLGSTANGSSASGGIGIDKPGTYYIGQANTGGFDKKTSSTVTLAPGAWNCIELEVDTTSPNGQMLGWDDNSSGAPDPALDGPANLQSLVFARFGLDFNGPSSAFDLYIDDVAISNTYISCNE